MAASGWQHQDCSIRTAASGHLDEEKFNKFNHLYNSLINGNTSKQRGFRLGSLYKLMKYYISLIPLLINYKFEFLSELPQMSILDVE